MTEPRDFLEISSLFKTFLKGVSQDWNKQGIRISQTHFKTLYVLRKEGPMMVSQLAAALCLTPAAMTGITDQMLAEGYVRKERAEGDRRVVNITLTEQGESKIQEVHLKQKEVMDGYFSILSDEDMDHLKRIFLILVHELDKK